MSGREMSSAASDRAQKSFDARFAELVQQLEACGCMPTGNNNVGAAKHSAAESEACDAIVDHLFELLDHAMPRQLEQAMMDHASGCSHCRPAIDAELRLREMLKRSCCERAPQEVRMRIMKISAQFVKTGGIR